MITRHFLHACADYYKFSFACCLFLLSRCAALHSHNNSCFPNSTVFPDKNKDSEHPGFPAPKPLSLQPSLSSSRSAISQPVPSLVPSHLGKHHAAPAGGLHGALAAAMMSQRTSETAWFTRQRGQGQEREGLLEMGLRSPGKGVELRRDSHR